MNVVALLSFYDEPVGRLVRCVDGLAQAGVAHLVAVDGRYDAFPDDRDVSPADQRAHLDGACRHHGIGLTMFVPSGSWLGNEPQKRTMLFTLGLACADPGDWFWVIDADMVVTKAPPEGVATHLALTDREAAEVSIIDVPARQAKRPDWPESFPMRCLFRAQPIAVGPQHWHYYSLHDGHSIWKGTDREGLEEPLDLTGLVEVEHQAMRDAARNLKRSQYYTRRDNTGLEMGGCPRCQEATQATRRIVVADRIMNGLPVGHVEEVCERHAEGLLKLNRRKLIQWGLPPDTPFNERYALPA